MLQLGSTSRALPRLDDESDAERLLSSEGTAAGGRGVGQGARPEQSLIYLFPLSIIIVIVLAVYLIKRSELRKPQSLPV